MAAKRSHSPGIVQNPFIKRRNLDWTLDIPRPPSPRCVPQERACAAAEDDHHASKSTTVHHDKPSTSAAIEAGRLKITDHLANWTTLLSSHNLPLSSTPSTPRLPLSAFTALYTSCLGPPSGAHFVIHQHDHPVAGTHYDLRLQINGNSSASWAVMYGPPGDPNSARPPLRNATETRVHCLWNHLVETASLATGSLLIWDTGTYTVLPPLNKEGPETDDEREGSEDAASHDADDANAGRPQTEQEKLATAFAARKIRLRLDGARLPRPYVLNLRLLKSEDAAGRARAAKGPSKRRRPRAAAKGADAGPQTSSDSDSDPAEGAKGEENNNNDDDDGDDMVPSASTAAPSEDPAAALLTDVERELRELEDEHVRRTNAYTGAHNSIGSIHQRKWYLSLDRRASGFERRRDAQGRVIWVQQAVRKEDEPRGHEEVDDDDDGGGGGGDDAHPTARLSYPFYVRGPEVERSVVTGRLGADILRDEGVVGHRSRKGWQPRLH